MALNRAHRDEPKRVKNIEFRPRGTEKNVVDQKTKFSVNPLTMYVIKQSSLRRVETCKKH